MAMEATSSATVVASEARPAGAAGAASAAAAVALTAQFLRGADERAYAWSSAIQIVVDMASCCT